MAKSRNFVILVLFVFLVLDIASFVSPIPEPSSSYCLEMGYKYEFVNGKGKCIFSDGQSCDSLAFYNGSCGKEYRKILACAKAGETRGVARECCEGLKEIPRSKYANGLCSAIVGQYNLCSNCGNGNCEAWENFCNCREDCNEKNVSSDSAESNLTQSKLRNQNQDKIKKIRASGENNLSSENRTRWKEKVEFVPWQKRNESECPEGCFCRGAVVSCKTENGKIMNISAGRSGNIIIIEVNRTFLETNLSVETEAIKNMNRTRMRAKLHNGEVKEIKIMPDEALQKVMQKLKLRYCNQTSDQTSEESICSLELKEASKGELKKAIYQIQIERHARILGIFVKKMKINAEIDSETGDLDIKKPWWAFIASEPKE